MGSNQDSPAIESEADLFKPFVAGFSAVERIGIEAEKFGVFSDGRPLHYAGSPGVPAIFEELSRRYGWRSEAEYDGGPALSLVRGNASVTLEPGSQLELSGSPHETVHDAVRELQDHVRELRSLECARDLHWLGLGFHPLARQEDLDWVPKSRYATMQAYFPTRGGSGLDMMRRTATVQANFDVADEADAMRKLRVALAAAPVVQAIFANSPVIEGRRVPLKSRRAEVWLDVDPDRTGLLPFAWRDGAKLWDYIEWALDVPMFILKRDGKALPNTHQTFRVFLRDGSHGHRAWLSDWETHLNTLFPEVRLKKTLEVRSADSVPVTYASALPAIWTGLLYDARARADAEALLLPFGHDAWAATRARIPFEALGATVDGTPLQSVASRLVEIAAAGLERRGRKNERGDDERIHLAALRELVARGQCVGDVLLGVWRDDEPDARAELLRRAAY